MAEQNTDPKVQGQGQGQGQTVGIEENEVGQAAFGGSDDFFDDPDFLSKIGQGNTQDNPDVKIDGDADLGDISNIFENRINTDEAKKDSEEEINLDLGDNNVIEDTKPEDINLEEPIEKAVEPEIVENKQEEINLNLENADIIGEQTKEIRSEEIKPEEVVIATEDVMENEILSNKNINEQKGEDNTEEVLEDSGSDFIKKFNELKKILSDVYEAKQKLGYETESFDIIGSNSDRNKITYNFRLDLDDGTVEIQKTELDKKTEEESEHILFLKVENDGLSVGMDEIMIFEEHKDLEKDAKKKIQVMDKINKFIFLAGEYQNTIQMELREKVEEEQEKKKMQDIFRNF